MENPLRADLSAKYDICFYPSETVLRGKAAFILGYDIEVVQYSGVCISDFNRIDAAYPDSAADSIFGIV